MARGKVDMERPQKVVRVRLCLQSFMQGAEETPHSCTRCPQGRHLRGLPIHGELNHLSLVTRGARRIT